MDHANDLAKRYSLCYDRYGNVYRCNSSWYNWGRWVALVVIVLGILFLFFIFACISSRRRRRAGRQPFYGTGWAGRPPVGHGQAQYNPGYQTQQPQYEQQQPQYEQQQPPPQYGQTGGYYGGAAAQSYYGGQQAGVEMQPPRNAYTQGGDNVYQPPAGPPPNKV